MSIKDNFPALKPSLSLDFANTKTLDPRITFSRASTGTYYDGVTHAKAEENLLTYSQEFDNGTAWPAVQVSVTANATTAPDGTATAEEITPNAVSSYFRVAQKPFSVSSAVTASVFVKANGYSKVAIREDQGSGAAATFDLSTGSVIGVYNAGAVTVSNNTITAYTNGWYRVSCTFTGGTSVGVGFLVLDPTYSSGAVTAAWTANGTDGIYIWGAQLEERSSVTAYTATTTQPITNYIPVLQSAAAGEARFDHDPVTGESKGLLIEEQRTNLFPYSEDFTDAAWGKVRTSITSNVIVAPDGTLTGDKLVENTDTNSHYVRESIAIDTDYTFSVYLKAGERTKAQLAFNLTSGVTATFDLSAGTATANSANLTADILDAGNGWYRCIVTSQIDVTDFADIALLDGSGTQSYTGDGYSGIYIWGAQLEAGAFPTSYIKTTSAQATRSADSASMTGTNFSEWYRQDEGTLYGEFQGPSGGRVFNLDNGTPNQIALRLSNSSGLFVRVNNSSEATLSADTSGDQFYKLAGAYKVNDFAQSLDGATAQTDASGILPSPVEASIGSYSGATSAYLNGHIKKLAYYPARLTNAQLQALTEG